MAISVVQTASNSGTSVSTLSVTLTATAGGTSVIVCLGGNVARFATGVTVGGTAMTNAFQVTDSGTLAATEEWYLDNVPSGVTSVVVTWSASVTAPAAVAYEVSGLVSTGSLDKTSTGSANSATSPLAWSSGTTATLSQASEIAIGCSGQSGLPTITGPSSPWVNTRLPASGSGIEAGYDIVSATTGLAYAGSSTHSGTLHIGAGIATYKMATAVTQNATVAATGSGTPAVGGTVRVPAAASLSGSGTFSAGVTQRPGMAASGTGTASAAAVQRPGVAASGSGTATVTAINLAPMATLADTFPGTTLNSQWSTFGSGTVAVSSGTLSLTDVAFSAAYTGIRSAVPYALANSYLLAQLTSAGSGGMTTQALLGVYDATQANGLSMLVNMGNLVVQKLVNGTSTTLGMTTYSAAAMQYLRIRETSGTCYFEYSANGLSWTAVTSAADPIQVTNLYAILEEGQYGGMDSAATSTWDNVNTVVVYQTVAASGSGSMTAGGVLAGGISVSGGGSASAGSVQQPGVAASGSGSLTAAAVQQPGVSSSGTGAASAGPVLVAGVSGSGSGTASAGTVQQPGVSGSGSGAAAAAWTAPGGVSASGTGTAAGAAVQGAGVQGSGSGLAAAGAVQQAGVAASGSGSAVAAAGGAAVFASGTGTFSAAEVQKPGAGGTGSGTPTAGGALGGYVAASGTGTASAGVTARPSVAASGTGTASAAVAGGAAVAASGSGALSTSLRLGAGVSAAGTGSGLAGARQGAGGAFSGAGLITVGPPVLARMASVLASGTGVLTASVIGLITVRDSDSCYMVDSGFTYITDTDSCSAADASAGLGLSDTDSCSAADIPLIAWPSDTDSCAAAEQEVTAWPRDADACSAADGGETVVPVIAGETCSAAESFPPIEVYTYVPLIAIGPGGGFEVVYDGQVVIRGRSVTGEALRFARDLGTARSVKFVRSGDCVRSGDSEGRPISVAVSVLPDVVLAISVLSTASS